MKKTAVLSVIEITESEDKNKKTYKNIKVQTPGVALVMTDFGMKAVKVKQRISSFNAWEESYLQSNNSAPDFGYDSKVGDLIAGAIVTRKVKTTLTDKDGAITGYADTYTIANEDRPDTVTDEYSAVVLGDTSDEEQFEQAIRTTFRRAGHPLVDDPTVTGKAKLADRKPEMVGTPQF